MLVAINGTTKHVHPVAPHHVTIPAKADAMQAWENIKKRIKDSDDVRVLDRYLLTR